MLVTEPGFHRNSAVFAIALLVYVLLPGHPELPLHGVPLGLPGTVFAVVAATCAFAGRRLGIRSTPALYALLLLATLGAVRVAVASSARPHGWQAQYFGNDGWSGSPEWSSDFGAQAATRIDRVLSFEGDRFPVHYLNGHTFARGDRREVSEGMSVIWSGETIVAGPTIAELKGVFRGGLAVSIDATPLLSQKAAEPEPFFVRYSLAAGSHVLDIRYVKPANVEGLIRLDVRAEDTGAFLPIYPPGTTGVSSRFLKFVAATSDAVAVIALVALLVFIWLRQWADTTRRSALITATVLFLLFGIQGWAVASAFDGRYAALNAGDDWFGFESRARDILQHGPLMTLGAPLGLGAPYFYHPFYSYFLAAVHALTGESLAGPIFSHFLILAAVTLIMWALCRRYFGERAAAFGAAALVVFFELDFVRYYTVTLLSENLYVFTVTCTMVAFARWVERGRPSNLVLTGLCAGVSSVTRPTMLIYLLPALMVVVCVTRQHRKPYTSALLSAAVLAVVWLAAVMPATIRNRVVSGRAVLVSEGVGAGVIRYNVPDGVDTAPYMSRYSGSAGSGLLTLARIAWEHPRETVKLQLNKIGFSLGMVHWRGGYRPHPELIGAMLLYFLMCWCSPILRSPAFWPVHAFVCAHVASLTLTDPSNYGYRLILPPFVFTTTLGVAALAKWLSGDGAPASGVPVLTP